jgi:hypothetical protein
VNPSLTLLSQGALGKLKKNLSVRGSDHGLFMCFLQGWWIGWKPSTPATLIHNRAVEQIQQSGVSMNPLRDLYTHDLAPYIQVEKVNALFSITSQYLRRARKRGGPLPGLKKTIEVAVPQACQSEAQLAAWVVAGFAQIQTTIAEPDAK